MNSDAWLDDEPDEHFNVEFYNHFSKCDYEIVEDVIPYEDGGFILGARFTKIDLAGMLEWHSISVGAMVRQIKSGVEFPISYKKAVCKTHRNKSIQFQHIDDMIAKFRYNYEKEMKDESYRHREITYKNVVRGHRRKHTVTGEKPGKLTFYI